MTEYIQKRKERCVDLTDHALVDPGSASPRMRCIGGRATSGKLPWKGISLNCLLNVMTPISFVLIFYFVFQPRRDVIPPSLRCMCVYSIGNILTGPWLRPLMSQPQENQKRPSSSSKGKGRLPASSSTPLLFRRRELVRSPPFFVWFDSIHQNLNSGTKFFSQGEK
jgi:hypothetical protein